MKAQARLFSPADDKSGSTIRQCYLEALCVCAPLLGCAVAKCRIGGNRDIVGRVGAHATSNIDAGLASRLASRTEPQ
ncbi:hypothetical protein CCR94_17780 [Rhodoblastus sphagnicola]|uniref:Uncharacterized protein n=1 Tax=Rhodoblastus sphagnicola TaxID=333368 RepID=A0A2S6N1D3_9HYPH|nr:hypothetical protein CCR94_17780 [Rhodoblastus sphagnicola]